MTAELTENFIVETGQGGNGKGLLNEMLFSMLGGNAGYAHKGNVAVLQQPLGTGGNPEVARLDAKRFHICAEPSISGKLDTSTIKAFTGDTALCARMLHSNKLDVFNCQTAVLECNDKPQFNGRMDDSITRRIVLIEFVCSYKDPGHADLLANVPNVYVKNPKYKLSTWQRAQRCVFFELMRRWILDHRERGVPGTILVAPRLRAYTNAYVEASDVGVEWFKEHYERDAEHDGTLSVTALHAIFTDSEEYRHLERGERMTWKLKGFIDRLERTLPTGDYRARYSGQRRVLLHWKERAVDGSALWGTDGDCQ